MKVRIIFLLLFFNSCFINAQEGHLGRLIDGELRMTFPSIYFKHNSTEYAAMPYSVDSCYKYIVKNAKDISDYAIWRDSSETETLTSQRIKKIQAELKKYKLKGKINIENMHEAQKISQYTINLAKSPKQTEYLLCLNSAFDISKTRLTEQDKQINHILHPRIWCWSCLTSLGHIDKRSRNIRKTYRMAEEKEGKKKERRHLVWTGWKHGFHWSTGGKK
jgi:hypothetical protein